ncbi:cysteine hydrolase family protein [Agrococcus sp. TF02-05]|uniref:cysteine hydrolase family protein n=1 Tax=Agrococcus sp. TF02-05 TaxID=2815211 RepID=UPI001AA147EA|nr:cysteine hydrolase [Agrococcus sp. TF02-05]MBO1769284.1 cysteine hydrolase [Agrococcus sp. TF02-05]
MTALVAIDMQQIFRESEWATPGYDAPAERIERLVEAASGPVLRTCFVRDPAKHGSWRGYYDRWSGCREEPDSAVWELTRTPGDDDAVITLPTFSKGGDALAAATDGHDPLVAGVVSGCCVLSTVLGAVDAGGRVTVVTDACAGATDVAHAQALALMEMLGPMVQLAETSELLRADASAVWLCVSCSGIRGSDRRGSGRASGS